MFDRAPRSWRVDPASDPSDASELATSPVASPTIFLDGGPLPAVEIGTARAAAPTASELAFDGPHGGTLAGPHSAPSRRVADKRDQQAKQDKNQPNAIIKVVVFGKGERLQTWRSRARWEGPLPRTFTARRTGAGWTWDDADGKSVKVETDARGQNGQSVEAWATSGDKIVVYAQTAADVTLNEDAEENGLAPGHAKHEEDAGDGSTDRRRPEGRGPDTGQATSPGAEPTQRQQPAPDPRHRSLDDTASQGGTSNTAQGEREGDVDCDFEPTEIDEQLADAFELDLGVDSDAEDMEDRAAATPHGTRPGGQGEPGGERHGRMGDDTREGGTGPGGEHARHGGDGEGSEARGGSMDGSAQGSRDGQKDGAPEGMYGGKGELGADGVPAGSGLIGGLIGIPATLKGAVELALILADGNVTGAGSGLFKRGLGKIATAVAARKMIASQARVTAVKETKTAIKQLATNPKTAAAWRAASKEEKAAVTRRMYWELQRRYFDAYLEAARQAKREATTALKRSAKNAAAQQKLATAEMAEEAATVKPVAGQLPRNHELAGKSFPSDLLPAQYRAKGVKFTPEGYPDFAPHAKQLPNGKISVEIEYTGSRKADFAAANKKAGLSEIPLDYTWHHVEDGKTMILVPTELHRVVKHSGGAATYKHGSGVEAYGN